MIERIPFIYYDFAHGAYNFSPLGRVIEELRFRLIRDDLHFHSPLRIDIERSGGRRSCFSLSIRWRFTLVYFRGDGQTFRLVSLRFQLAIRAFFAAAPSTRMIAPLAGSSRHSLSPSSATAIFLYSRQPLSR